MRTIAKTYRGLTVELGAETSGLGKALKDVNKKSRDLRTELRKVQRGLKFNPQDTELLAQKQKLLSEKVENTSEKLRRLRKVEDQVKQQFESGEIGEQQYRDFRRQIVQTESKLETFEGQLKETAAQSDELAQKLNKTSGQLQNAGEKMTGLGEKLSMGLTAPLTAAFVGLTQGTRDFRKEISVLDNNIESANASSENINKAMAKTKAVTDDTRASVEGLSNLLAADFKGDQFQQVLDNLNGAALKFKETIKFEEVSNALQETLGSGEAVGQFAELLERTGVDLENFEEGLARAKKQGEEHNYVLQTLADTGLSDVYDQYRKNNEELVNSAEANYNLQESLGELGSELEPIMTKITNATAGAVEKFNSLDEETKDFIITSGGIAAAFGPGLTALGKMTEGMSGLVSGTGKIIGKLSNLKGKMKGVELATIASSSAFMPFLVGGTILAGITAVTSAVNELNEEMELLEKDTSEIGNIDKLNEQLDLVDRKIKSTKETLKNVAPNENGEFQNVADAKVYKKLQAELNDDLEKRREILSRIKGLRLGEKGAEYAKEQKKQEEKILKLLQEKSTAYRAGRLEKEKYKEVLQGVINNEENSDAVVARARTTMQGLTSDAKDLDSAVSNISDEAGSIPDFMEQVSYSEALSTAAKSGENVMNTMQDMSDEYHQNAVEAVENAEKLQERYELEEKWANELYQVKDKTAQEELARLEKEKQAAIKKAKKKGADTTDIVKTYELKKDKVREKYVEKEQKRKDRIMQYKIEQEEISYETYINYLEKRLSEEEKYSDEWISIQEKITNAERKQLEKRKGFWADFAESIDSEIQDAFSAILDESASASDAFENIWDKAVSNVSSNIGDKLTKGMDGIAGEIAGSASAGLIESAIDYGAEWYRDLFDDIEAAWTGSDTAAASWDKKYKKMRKEYNKEFSKISDFELSIPDFSNLVDKDLREINKKVEDGGWFHSDDYDMVKNLPKYSEAFKEKMKELSEEIMPKLKNIFSDVRSNLKGAFDADSYDGFLENFGASLKSTVLDNLKQAFLKSESLKPLMKKLSGTIYDATKDGVLTEKERKEIKKDSDKLTKASKKFYEGYKVAENALNEQFNLTQNQNRNTTPTNTSSGENTGGGAVERVQNVDQSKKQSNTYIFQFPNSAVDKASIKKFVRNDIKPILDDENERRG